jgi:hypothetical protein
MQVVQASSGHVFGAECVVPGAMAATTALTNSCVVAYTASKLDLLKLLSSEQVQALPAQSCVGTLQDERILDAFHKCALCLLTIACSTPAADRSRCAHAEDFK